MFNVWKNSRGEYCATKLNCTNPVAGHDVFRAESFYIFAHRLHEQLNHAAKQANGEQNLHVTPVITNDLNGSDFDASD